MDMEFFLTILTVVCASFTSCVIGLALGRRWRLGDEDRIPLAGVSAIFGMIVGVAYTFCVDLDFLVPLKSILWSTLVYAGVVLGIKAFKYGFIPLLLGTVELLVRGINFFLDRIAILCGERRVEAETVANANVDEVTALRQQVSDLERQLAEARQTPTCT